MMPAYKLKELIKQKEDELFWKRFDANAILSGETERLEGEIKILKRLYWEMMTE
ncbi:hypothetical protein [Thermococcus sp. Bubb.Bath]|uniref:hypothetical protein n=1 Tax=Thermococcus sp. Bubb.Bath TaxID=1638242 RepID=UPI00143BDE66|nr:hypothetical protein [Thermococcus sp. Bubb.Bath]